MPATSQSVHNDPQTVDRSSGIGGERLAEAARYAVLGRIAPKLHHDVAGALQPIGMIAMVMQRRMQATAPDLQAISKNMASVSALAKEATASSLGAISWLAPRKEVKVERRVGVQEVLNMLAVELSSAGLMPVNSISDAHAAGEPMPQISQDFLRTVLAAVLLTCCDEPFGTASVCSRLDISVEDSIKISQIVLRRTAETTVMTKVLSRPPARQIKWADVGALASSFGVAVTRGDGWVALELPAQ